MIIIAHTHTDAQAEEAAAYQLPSAASVGQGTVSASRESNRMPFASDCSFVGGGVAHVEGDPCTDGRYICLSATHRHTQRHTQTHTQTHRHTDTQTQTHAHARTRTQPRTHTHPPTHAHARTWTRTPILMHAAHTNTRS